MELRDSDHYRGVPSSYRASPLFAVVLFACAVALASIGCATPGEPTDRKPPIPAAVTDLATTQQGNDIVLTFMLPKETADHHPLKKMPSVEIYRDFVPAFVAPVAGGAPGTNTAGSSAAAGATLWMTIPADLVGSYVEQGRFRYSDALKSEDFSRADGGFLRYMVRTRASTKRDSPDSNAAELHVYPAPNPITDVKAQVTHAGIALTWTPPQNSPVGAAPAIAGYNVYRAEAEPEAGASGAASSSANPALKSPLMRVGETTTAAFEDTHIEFGNAYVYSVRSVVQEPGRMLESADSNLVYVLARDTFPPAAPQRLVVAYVPAQGSTPAHVEISWAISTETDLAGYNVYRSEQAGVLGDRLNSSLLPTPAFQDFNAVPGRQYFYSVTAVDRSGNESPASEVVPGGAPAESPAP